ncbi:MAG: adenylate/guanylate cyclase domain-containing protein [Myxococcota bacterium]
MARELAKSPVPVALGTGAGALLVLAGFGRSADLAVLDTLQVRMAPRGEPAVVIVDIDPQTIATFGWPLDPALYAAAVQSLSDAHAKGIGIDVVFGAHGAVLDAAPVPETPVAQRSSDRLLGDVAARTGTVLASQVWFRAEQDADAVLPVTPAGTAPAECPQTAPTSPRASSSALAPLRPGLEAARRAQVHAPPDPVDGVVRSIRPCQPVHDGCVPNLASAVFDGPVGCEAEALVPYGRAWSDFPRISLYDLVTASGDAAGAASLEAKVGGRYVLIGPSDRSIADVGRTPASHSEPLVALHANWLQALVEGRRLAPVAPSVLTALAFLIALGGGLLRVGARAWVGLGIGSVGLGAAVTVGAFAASAWVAPLPLIAPWLGACVGGALHQGWLHLRFNQMLTQAFGRYVSPDVLEWLQATEGAALDPRAAERRVVSVLFSDIAGYTQLSNRLPPDRVMASLRLYLEAMIEIVAQHGGYLDKINGDGLMVLFGAPRALDDAPKAAIDCALAMQACVKRLQPEWAAITEGDLAIRVGVATGPAFVGNLGGDEHIEYTAIGPVVNLAARLEPKAPPGGLVMCSDTKAALASVPDGRWVEVALKGYEAAGPIRGWEIPPAS